MLCVKHKGPAVSVKYSEKRKVFLERIPSNLLLCMGCFWNKLGKLAIAINMDKIMLERSVSLSSQRTVENQG